MYTVIQLKYHCPLCPTFNLHGNAMALFPEEQLDSPLGYFPAQPGQLLKNGTWTINRKLGWGPRSSTWLVIDKDDQYSALKILTAAATADQKAKNESYFLLGLVKAVLRRTVPQLLEMFEERDEQGRKHFCLLFMPLGTSVEDLRQGMSRIYPFISSRRSLGIFRNVWLIWLLRTSFMVVCPTNLLAL